MTMLRALDRTIRLVRDEVHDWVSDQVILDALTSNRVALVSDAANLTTHSAQTAFITSALLAGRSGHAVQLVAPDVDLVGVQLPLKPGRLIEQLMECGSDLLPDLVFSDGPDGHEVDLAIGIGDSPIPIPARRVVRLNADTWSGRFSSENNASRWGADDWPFGAMAAAALAATEAFKGSMWKLRSVFGSLDRLNTVFAPAIDASFDVAPAETRRAQHLGEFDWISGGAITNSALYSLARIPSVSGGGRVIEPDFADLTNLNRYMLLRHSSIEKSKGPLLAKILKPTLDLHPIEKLFDASLLDSISPLSDSVLVGVDHIPTRWAVQRAQPEWLAIGATTHWSAMASFHRDGLACAQCLHPEDDPNDGPIPTVAFVSFWAGLLTAAYFLRFRSGEAIPRSDQYVYVTPFRPETPFRSSVASRRGCPICNV